MDNQPAPSVPLSLAEASAQDIQLELIRRTQYNAFDGERVFASLLAHRDLWLGVLMDRFGLDRGTELPAMSLIKLRDLPGGHWNVDTLFVLTADLPSAMRLAEIAESEDWAGEVQVHEDREEVERALGGSGGGHPVIVSIWWD